MANHAEDLERGRKFQDYVMKVLLHKGIVVSVYSSKEYQYAFGESPQGIEIKMDSNFLSTNRLSIEIASRTDSNREWGPSGIYDRKDPWLYIQGYYGKFWLFSTLHLKQLYESGMYDKAEPRDDLRTFYLPMRDVEKWSITPPSYWVGVGADWT